MAAKRSKANKGGLEGAEALESLADDIIALGEKESENRTEIAIKAEVKKLAAYTAEIKKQFVKELIAASSEIQSEIEDALIDNMETPMWPWPRSTKRVTGGVVGSPRDIIDTQDLQDRNSVKVAFLVKGFKFTITNSAPYSGIVHYGGYVGSNLGRGRGTYVPGRPWISLTIGVKPRRGSGALSIPGAGVAVVDYQSRFSEAMVLALTKAINA